MKPPSTENIDLELSNHSQHHGTSDEGIPRRNTSNNVDFVTNHSQELPGGNSWNHNAHELRKTTSLDTQSQQIAPPGSPKSQSSLALSNLGIESSEQANSQSSSVGCPEVDDEGRVVQEGQNTKKEGGRMSKSTMEPNNIEGESGVGHLRLKDNLKPTKHSQVDNSARIIRQRRQENNADLRSSQNNPRRLSAAASGNFEYSDRSQHHKASDKRIQRRVIVDDADPQEPQIVSKATSSFHSSRDDEVLDQDNNAVMKNNAWHGIEPLYLKKPFKSRPRSICSSSSEYSSECLEETTEHRQSLTNQGFTGRAGRRQSESGLLPQKVSNLSRHASSRRFSNVLLGAKDEKDGNGTRLTRTSSLYPHQDLSGNRRNEDLSPKHSSRRIRHEQHTSNKDLSSGSREQKIPRGYNPKRLHNHQKSNYLQSSLKSNDLKSSRRQRFGAAPWAAVASRSLYGNCPHEEDEEGQIVAQEDAEKKMDHRRMSKSLTAQTNSGEFGAGPTLPRRVSKSTIHASSADLNVSDDSQTENNSRVDCSENQTRGTKKRVPTPRTNYHEDDNIQLSNHSDQKLVKAPRSRPTDGNPSYEPIGENNSTKKQRSHLPRVCSETKPLSIENINLESSNLAQHHGTRDERIPRRNTPDGDVDTNHSQEKKIAKQTTLRRRRSHTLDTSLKDAESQEIVPPRLSKSQSMLILSNVDIDLLEQGSGDEGREIQESLNKNGGESGGGQFRRVSRSKSTKQLKPCNHLQSDNRDRSDQERIKNKDSDERSRQNNPRRRFAASKGNWKASSHLQHPSASENKFSRRIIVNNADSKVTSSFHPPQKYELLQQEDDNFTKNNTWHGIEPHDSKKLLVGKKPQNLQVQEDRLRSLCSSSSEGSSECLTETTKHRAQKSDNSPRHASSRRFSKLLQDTKDETDENGTSCERRTDDSRRARRMSKNRDRNSHRDLSRNRRNENLSSKHSIRRMSDEDLSSGKDDVGQQQTCHSVTLTKSEKSNDDNEIDLSNTQKASTCSLKSKGEGASSEKSNTTRTESLTKNNHSSAIDKSVHSNPSSRSSAGSKSSGSTTSAEAEARKKYGFYVSPFMLCTICFWYGVTSCLVGFMGFGIRILLFSEKEEPTTTDNRDSPTSYNRSDDGLLSGINSNGDGSMVTKLLPSTGPSYSPSTSPFVSPSLSPSISPSISPSLVWSKSFPSTSPSLNRSSSVPKSPMQISMSSLPSLSPRRTSSIQPSSMPSYFPSFNPTSAPECPEQLVTFATLGNGLILRYQVVPYKGDMNHGLGGLLCISFEYTGGAAGWIGLAFSEASRDPRFGRKEAIIGIPGLGTSEAVATDGSSRLGQHAVPRDGPMFFNPGKYIIPAGGIEDEFSGPSLKLLSNIDKQTLINGSIFTLNAYLDPDDAVLDSVSTKMSFVKYLREPGEIEIDPYQATLLLYAVASPLNDGTGGYNDNPEWKRTRLNFLNPNLSKAVKSRLHRRRKRRHPHGGHT